jgi:predicted alpha/beta-hydrolase family hydrolase
MRDPFGTPDEVAEYPLAASIRLAWIEDGDHSFKPRRQSGRTWEQNLDQAVEAVLDFVASR